MGSDTKVWGIAEARTHLSRVIDQAINSGPQTITRNGRQVAVLVSVEEWERKTNRQGTLADFLAASPLRGIDIDLERVKDGPREIDP